MSTSSKFKRLLCFTALLALAARAQADGVTGRISTLGGGIEYGFGLSSTTLLRMGVNGASSSTTGNEGSFDYDLTLKLRSTDLL